MDMKALRAEIEAELSRQLAPELAAMGAIQVYIVLASDQSVPFHGRFYGQYHPRAAVWLRDAIGERWRGNAPAWVVDDWAILNDAVDDSRVKSMMWGVCVHEAAHAIVIPTATEAVDFCPEVESIASRIFARSLQSTDASREAEACVRRSRDHGPEWFRVATHLWRRLPRRRGLAVDHRDIFHPHDHDLTMDEAWWLLRQEIVPLMGTPLSEIARLPIPRALAARWDVAEAAC